MFFTRPHLADYMQDRAEIRSRTDALFALVRDGRFGVAMDRVLPLDEVSQAPGSSSPANPRKLVLRV